MGRRRGANVAAKNAIGHDCALHAGALEKLILFLDHPILRLDTKPVEGVIRPFVVGRNNWILDVCRHSEGRRSKRGTLHLGRDGALGRSKSIPLPQSWLH